MAAYTKNKDGYYKRTITVGKKPDGKPDQVVIRSRSLSEFKELVKEAENRRDHGYDFDAKDMTVAEWAAKWMEIYKKPKIQENSLTTYDNDIRLHINPIIGSYKMTDVKSYQLQELLNAHEGKSKSHVDKLTMCIKSMFKRAYIDGVIVKDVSEGLEPPESVEGEKRPLTDKERAAVIEVAKTHRAGLWVLVMLFAGLRPEEVAGLMWGDIDFTVGSESITVRRAVSWKNNRPTTKKPKKREHSKGKDAERSIPISGMLVDMLSAAKAKTKSLYVFTPAQSDGMMTLSCTVRMWRSFHRAVDRYMGAKTYRNKITVHAFPEEITPYYLRHTCCTHWFEIGMDLKTVQYLMGHRDIATTANIYTHVTSRSTGKAADLIRADATGQTLDKQKEGREDNG